MTVPLVSVQYNPHPLDQDVTAGHALNFQRPVIMASSTSSWFLAVLGLVLMLFLRPTALLLAYTKVPGADFEGV